jgi:hypothetical protein
METMTFMIFSPISLEKNIPSPSPAHVTSQKAFPNQVSRPEKTPESPGNQ